MPTVPFTDSPGRWKAVRVEGGKSEMTWSPTPDMANPIGNVHGGVIATLIDEVTGSAVMSLIEAASAPTVSMHVEYLHPVPIGGNFTAFGEVARIGRAMAIVDGRILDEDGKVLARGTCIFQIPRPK